MYAGRILVLPGFYHLASIKVKFNLSFLTAIVRASKQSCSMVLICLEGKKGGTGK